jgi:hypothetical protein
MKRRTNVDFEKPWLELLVQNDIKTKQLIPVVTIRHVESTSGYGVLCTEEGFDNNVLHFVPNLLNIVAFILQVAPEGFQGPANSTIGK